MMMAASLAYYTLFAMPPLLFLLVTIVSFGMSTTLEQEAAEEKAESYLQQQAAQLIGDQAAAKEIGAIIESTKQQKGTWWKSALSLFGVVVGATGVVNALQTALNHVWRVQPSGRRFALRFLMKRLLSFAMILGFGFLLFVSFIITTVLSLISVYAAEQIGLQGNMPRYINHGVSFATTWVFFTAIFRIMPDADISLKYASLGGLFTVSLFTLGRVVLFYYLSLANPAENLGSAASLLIVLIWVYYSSIILLFGAEFTAIISNSRGRPEQGAVGIEEQIIELPPPGDTATG